MNDYIVGVYTNHPAKQFSITARHAADTNLQAMNTAEAENGFSFHLLAIDLSKVLADAFKTRLRGDLELAGYAYMTRQRP
jgi:hypothetical protein